MFDRPTASSEDSQNASTLLLSTSPSRLSRKRRSRTQVRWAKRVFVTTALLFLVVGVLLTTLGFVGLDLSPKLQLALRILGPVCLTVDLVTCLVCAIVVHLWKEEWRRRRRATELRNRVLLHALTIDFLANSSQLDTHLQNPKICRSIIRQLRRRTSADVCRFIRPFIRSVIRLSNYIHSSK